jgi:hypothetical protein
VTIPALIAAILLMMGGSHTPRCKHTRRAAFAAPLILDALAAYPTTLDVGINDGPVTYRDLGEEGDALLVAAVMARESGFKRDVVGHHGEGGLMQIKPDGMALRFCRGLDLHKPRDNVRCGVRLLHAAHDKCGGGPERWLRSYNSPWNCGASEYTAKVLATLRRALP